MAILLKYKAYLFLFITIKWSYGSFQKYILLKGFNLHSNCQLNIVSWFYKQK